MMRRSSGVSLRKRLSVVRDKLQILRRERQEAVAKGKTKDEIKDALVKEYGPEVLAVPSDDGFDLIGGWILPVVAVLAGATVVGLAALRWRRDQRRDDAIRIAPAGPDPESDEGRRLREDLERYDS